MRCPKCDADMEEVRCDQEIVQRCTACKGLWFDKGKAVRFLVDWRADQIDTGDLAIGKQQDKNDIVPCPRCGGTMHRLFDIDGMQILYEQCDEHGQFFDAGEFTVWAEHYIL